MSELKADRQHQVSAEKRRALDMALAHIRKDYGNESIIKMGEHHAVEIESIPTGSLALDLALDVGGFPKGRVIEIYGPESSGKTTLTLHAVAECQKLGGLCAFIDAEHALDISYARRIGIKVDDLYLSQPDNGEQAVEIAERLVRSNVVDLIVIDSVAALTPKAEIEGDMEDAHVGLQARLMSKALRKLTSALAATNSKCIIIFINQIRMKIGVMFGNPETTTGGHALKYYSSVRLDIRKSTVLKDQDRAIGQTTKVKIVKNKVGRPHQEAVIDIIYGKGIRRESEAVVLGVKYGIIEKSGSWFAYGGTKIGQGQENATKYLVEHPEVFNKIEQQIRTAAKNSNILMQIDKFSDDTESTDDLDNVRDVQELLDESEE